MTMNEKQGAAEWLRGIVDGYEANGAQSCSGMAKMFGIYCEHVASCRDCMTKMMTAIADRIDAERALPEGVEWPRFEDGEMVKFGDEVEFEGEAAKVLDVAFSVVRFSLGVGTATTSGRVYGFLGEPAKRPAPKVLDADGVPIKVGDTVWATYNGCKHIVMAVCSDGSLHPESATEDGCMVEYEKGMWDFAKKVTHEQPDSWEKLENDAKKTSCGYASAPRDENGLTTCEGCRFQKTESCSQERRLEVLKRAKKLGGVDDAKEASDD